MPKDFPPAIATVDARLHAAYLALKALDKQPPTADALARLIRSHRRYVR